MITPTVQQWETLDKLYELLTKYPQTLIAIPIVWVLMILFFDRVLDVHITPWWGLMMLIASVGIVIGILLLSLS